jgi:cellulose synthase/poly-beta-1,6-N-acetylglucosamine synthase-like glycosyltransferase
LGEAVELPGSSYLYTIATLSITYAGFAALLVIFRQIIGGGVSKIDVYLIRLVLMRSFIIAFSAMLPPALAFFDLSQSVIWRMVLTVGIRKLDPAAQHVQATLGRYPHEVGGNCTSKTTCAAITSGSVAPVCAIWMIFVATTSLAGE